MVAPTTGHDYSQCRPFEEATGPEGDHACIVHGGWYSYENRQCQTLDVLDDVRAERARQFAKYGTNSSLDYGTGEPWLMPLSVDGVDRIQESLRADYEVYKQLNGGKPTWMHLVREEVAEAFVETNPQRLRAELLQVAALCVSWVEKIDARGLGLE